MAAFYDNLPADDAATLDRLARLLLDLRDSRGTLLARHGAEDEDELLDKIRTGGIAEHPAYEDYLGARTIATLREAIRADLKDCMLRVPAAMNLHGLLADEVVNHFGERLTGAPQLTHDALTLELDSGVAVQARFASATEYSIHWRQDTAGLRIDTAPLHTGLASFPNHLHMPDGSVLADPLTRPGNDPWENLQAVLRAILQDPALPGCRRGRQGP